MEPATFITLFFLSGLICAILGRCVAAAGRESFGFLLGLILGPIGVIVAALLKPDATAPYVPTIHRQPDGPPPLPDQFTIRRGFGAAAEHYGPYSLEEVMNHLTSGALLPTDHYQTPAGHWSQLSKTGLI